MNWTEKDHIEWWEERAAILEFDAGLDRRSAERHAYWEWRRYFPKTKAPPPMTLWKSAA